MDECTAKGEHLFIPVLVLCETIWVLDRIYQQSRSQIAGVIESLLATDLFRFEHDRFVRSAFDAFRYSKADFSDYLIGEIARGAGCRDTVTFDRALKGSPGFTIL